MRLHRLIVEGKRPVIVDLRTSPARDQDRHFIPGALLADFAMVDQWIDQVPTDREVIFYCTCPNEVGAAQVARKLLDLGYTRVRPLLGGMAPLAQLIVPRLRRYRQPLCAPHDCRVTRT